MWVFGFIGFYALLLGSLWFFGARPKLLGTALVALFIGVCIAAPPVGTLFGFLYLMERDGKPKRARTT
jgi:hypothetical protein